MALLFHPCFCIILYIEIFVRDVRCASQNFSETAEFMDAFCPYNVICRTGEPLKETGIPGMEGCCSDCSCEDTCGLTESCCFPSLDIHHVVDRSHQKCTTSTPLPDSVDYLHHVAYNMVVDDYPNGQGIHCGDNVTKCGDNETATPIGSLYPVFSKRTGRIYKNIECAKCHGINENEVIKWKVWLTCESEEYTGNNYTDMFPTAVMSQLYSIESGELPRRCVYEFEYPGRKSDVKKEQCIAHPVSSCSEQFNRFDLNMTHDEIRYQCEMGVHSPYLIRYKNIFCFICTSFRVGINTNIMCKTETDYTRLNMVPFAVLIDPDIIENKMSIYTPERKNRIVCSSQINNNITSCREIHCSIGQVLHQNGKCVFAGKQWDNIHFSLNIKLVPQVNYLSESILHTGDINFKEMLSDQMLSPWPKSWKVVLFLYTATNKYDGEKVVDHFFVKIEIKKQRTDIGFFLENIQKRLRQDWYLFINGSLIANKQMISEFTRLQRNATMAKTKYIQPSYSYEERQARDTPIYTELMFINFLYSFTITKLFFCEQVQLLPDEYVIDIPAKVLYYLPENKIFFLGEFYAVLEDKAIKLVRICIEDSPFRLAKVMEFAPSSAKLSGDPLCWLVVVTILHMFYK